MSVGGIDIVLPAPANPRLGDVIVYACRRHWPRERCYFQDALVEDEVHPLDDPWVWTVGTTSREFFVYQNRKAVKSWEDGPTPKNVNTMLHFLVGEPLASDPSLVEVSLVCDKITPDIRRLVEDLRTSFSALVEEDLMQEAA